MHYMRDRYTTTLLNNGKVLVTGGIAAGLQVWNNAELYNPSTGKWTITGNLNVARCGHTATLLPNGKVLVAGGAAPLDPLRNAEIYDPSTGNWTNIEYMHDIRVDHTATLLLNGDVLMAGGLTNSAELYKQTDDNDY